MCIKNPHTFLCVVGHIGQDIIIIIYSMIISEADKKESAKVSLLLKRIELMDGHYVNTESDIMSQQQPFIISLLLGYNHELKAHELEEMMKIIFLIWEYFKDVKQINEVKISESQFERIHLRNINMLEYFEEEKDESEKMELVDSDLRHLNSKALFTGVLYQFNHKQALLDMSNKERGILLIGLKSLIECFEEIVNSK